MIGCAADDFEVSAYSVAWIMGEHFRAGEWGNRRCGSIITCVINGRSIYGIVRKFLLVDGDPCPGYASVVWFGPPEYPCGNPLKVRVSRDRGVLDREIGSIVRITQIDPSPVACEPENEHYWMMR